MHRRAHGAVQGRASDARRCRSRLQRECATDVRTFEPRRVPIAVEVHGVVALLSPWPLNTALAVTRFRLRFNGFLGFGFRFGLGNSNIAEHHARSMRRCNHFVMLTASSFLAPRHLSAIIHPCLVSFQRMTLERDGASCSRVILLWPRGRSSPHRTRSTKKHGTMSSHCPTM